MGTNYGPRIPPTERMPRRLKKGHVFHRTPPVLMPIRHGFVRQEHFWLGICAFCVVIGATGVLILSVIDPGHGLKSSAGLGIFAVMSGVMLLLGLVVPFFLYKRFKAIQKALYDD